MSAPSLAELRSKGQSQAVLDRLNDEHWFGRLYTRKLSPYATWVFVRLGWSPNAVTLGYITCGIAAAGWLPCGIHATGTPHIPLITWVKSPAIRRSAVPEQELHRLAPVR